MFTPWLGVGLPCPLLWMFLEGRTTPLVQSSIPWEGQACPPGSHCEDQGGTDEAWAMEGAWIDGLSRITGWEGDLGQQGPGQLKPVLRPLPRAVVETHREDTRRACQVIRL